MIRLLRDQLHTGDLTCVLCDHGVAQPLPGPWRYRFGPDAFAGTVRTVHLPDGEVPAVDRSLDDLAEGSVLLIRSDGDGAVWGGRLTARARRRGVAGVVVDGHVRDVRALRSAGLPLVARDVAPHRSDARGAGAIDVPLAFGGVPVEAGDVLVVDENGVVVLPRDRHARVRSELEGWVAEERRREE